MHIIVAAIATLLVIVGYSFAVSCHQPERFWGWLNALVGSGLSFFLAVLGGIYLFRLQNREKDKSELSLLRKLLSAEFSDLVRILSDSSRMELTLQSGAKRSVLIAFVQPLVIEKSALSGLFSQTESENLLHLARKVRMLNFKSEYMMSLVQSRSEEQLLSHAIDNVEQTRIAAIEDIRRLAQQLGVSINQNYAD